MEWTIRLNFKITIFGLSMYLWSEIFAKMCPTCKQNWQYHLQKTFTSKCSNLWSNLPFFKVWGRERPAKMAAVKFSRQISYFQLLCRRRRQVCLREYPFFFSRMMADPKQRELWKFSTFFKVTERTFCPTTPFVKLAWPSRRLSYLNFTHIVEMVL